tara:strand:- start:16357 stop:16752 length:396 start_codon:yes stop_codon:yes gene_type:complete
MSRNVQTGRTCPDSEPRNDDQPDLKSIGSVRIGGLDLPVLVDPSLESFGEFDPVGRVIRVGTGMAPEVLASTIIHEVLHAIDDALDLRLGERGVRAIETGLVAAARDDPGQARRWLAGLLAGPRVRGRAGA